MKVKTYGVAGLSEWHGKLKAGSIEVSVSFTGGTASPSGAQPAYFMTKDPVVQFVIENSKEFKNGFIKLVMSQKLPGTHPREAVPKDAVHSDVEAESVEKDDSVAADVADGEVNSKQHVNVSDRYEAVEWLKEHNPEAGYSSTKLRTKEAFDAACTECGVVFQFAGK